MDSVTAAAASMAQEIRAASVASKYCDACGRPIAWRKIRSGKWYLADATIGQAGRVMPGRTPHFKTCPDRT